MYSEITQNNEVETNRDTRPFVKIYNKAIPHLQLLSGTGLNGIPFLLWIAGNNQDKEILTIDTYTLEDFNNEIKRKSRKRGLIANELKERVFYRALKELQKQGVLEKTDGKYKINTSLIFNGSRKETTGKKDSHFIKIYTDSIFYFQCLSGTGLKLIPYILWLISKRKGSDTLTINNTLLNKFYKEAEKYGNVKRASLTTYNRALKELQEKHIIEKAGDRYRFNIELLFNGNRESAIKYNHERALKTIKDSSIVKYSFIDEIKEQYRKSILEGKIKAIESNLTIDDIYPLEIEENAIDGTFSAL